MANNVLPLKKPLPAIDTHLVQTRIVSTADDALRVEHPDCGRVDRALSCLIEPQTDDLVLLALNPSEGTGHVLAILERPGSQDAVLALPGGSAIRTEDGGMALQAKSLQFDGSEGIALNTATLELTAVSVTTTVKHWQAWFDTLEAYAVSIEYAAKTLSSKVGRLLSRSLESFRSIEGLDETRAGRSRRTVRGRHQLRAGHITAQAEGFVKIDGQKIDLG